MIPINIIVLGVTDGFCQNTLRPAQQVIPPSPTAGELAKYITYPVDLSNGLVKISIPLYEIVDGDIRIPITLNYHASGLKANIRSGDWIGDGWSLSTGPTLSRNINGGPDELSYYHDMLQNPQPTYQQLNQVVNQEKDIALDEFYYSLLNTAGRLYFKRVTSTQLKPVAIPRDSIEVSLPQANNHTNFIDIADTKGLQYHFGGTDRKFKDLMNNSYGVSATEVATAWKINEIHSPLTNRTVTFEYSSNITEVPFYRNIDDVIMLDNTSCQCTNTIPAVRVTNGSSENYYRFNLTTNELELTNPANLYLPPGYQFPIRGVQTITQYNSYINTIRFGGGRVTFTKSEGGRKGLTSIRVYDKSDALVKYIEFIQSTSGTPAVLTLDEIRINSLETSEVEKYNFLYTGSLLNRETRSVDRWGYYNGVNNSTLVPAIATQATFNNYPSASTLVSINIPGGNREPNETSMKQGVLTAIIHPTGGRTNFVYEAHRYQDNGNTKLAGGLRIKQVQHVYETGKIVYHNYKYSTLGTSINGAGLLNVVETGNTYPPMDNFYHYAETNCLQFSGSSLLSSTFKERRWTENSMINLFSENGSSVSYPYVTEAISSDANGNNVIGQKRHIFDISPSYPMKYQQTNIILDSKDGWSKGNPQSNTFFKSGSSLDTVLHKNFSHDRDFGYGDADNRIRQYYVYKSNRIYGASEDAVAEQHKKIEFVWKDLSTGHNRLGGEDEHTYSANGTIKEQTTYGYDVYGNISSVTKKTSGSLNGNEVTTTIYAKDMVDQARDPNGIYASMVGSNIVGVPIEVKTYRGSVSSANLLTTNTTQYARFNNLFFAPKELISKNIAASSDRKTLMNSYDSFGNPLEIKNMDLLSTVYLWGYNGQYPVAKVENATYSEVLTALGGGTTATNILSSLNSVTVSDQTINTHIQTIRTNLAKAQVSTYTYKPLAGMTSVTDARGIKEYYQYDGFQRLQRVLDFENNVLKDYQYHYKP
ncbi:hypothetical protein [Parapedobacter sp. DT-150]|uniref:hypothetical protein n=1 Tax=Parapedobacter sp. DT-150 TaxID=3396162 RepID=UPI003F1C512F